MKKRQMKTFACMLAGVAATGAMSACGKNSDSSSSAQGSFGLSASVGTGLNGVARMAMSADLMGAFHKLGDVLTVSSSPNIDTVLAYPLDDGEFKTWTATQFVKATVDSSGKFTIDLPKQDGRDYVIVLVDLSQTLKLDQVVGYLRLSDAGRGLMKLPVQDAKENSTVDVGTLTKASGSQDAMSSKQLSEVSDKFSLDIDTLREFAKTDSMLQSIKNVYANYKGEKEFATTSPYFVFHASLTSATGAYIAPEAVQYSGYGLYFDLAKPGLTFQSVCSGGSDHVALSLYPPIQIATAVDTTRNPSATATYYGPDAPLRNAGVTGAALESGSRYNCGDTEIYVHAEDYQGDGSQATVLAKENFGFNWGSGDGFSGSIAEGQWVLKAGSDEVGRFDLKSAAVVDSDGKPTIYIPSLKIEVNSSNVITAAYLKIYTYDKSTSSFTQVTDTKIFSQVAKQLTISLTDYGQSGTITEMPEFTDQGGGLFAVTSFTKGFKIGDWNSGTSSNPAASSVAISYEMYGAHMMFDFRPYYTP